MKHRLVSHVGLALFALSMACDAGKGDSVSVGGSGGSGQSSGAIQPDTSASTSDVVSSAAQFMTGSTGAGMTCNSGPDEDFDQDGFTFNQGDCNDCDKNVNPSAIEVVITDPDPMTGMVPEPADEDCDGTKDNPEAMLCDTGLPLAPGSAMDAAKAIELCKVASGPKDWGVVTAKFTGADGSAAGITDQVGVMPKFGNVISARGGDSLFVLASGKARTVGQAGACGTCSCGTGVQGTPPTGFPQDNGCGTADVIYDDRALELEIRAPSNAVGYGFDFRFFTFEYPDYVCSYVNDQFIALVNPPPTGSLNGNIAFDNMSNPVSVNIAFFDVCNVPGDPCNANAAEMGNTGFDVWNCGFNDGYAGGTSWLHTVAPVTGGQTFTIRFAIWDTGDSLLNSTSIIDNWVWVANGGTVTVGTNPVPQ